MASIALFATLILPLLATFGWLQFQKWSLKRSVKQRMVQSLRKTDLQFFALTTKEATQKLRWEHAQEFEYQGAMYDVVYKETTPDSLYIWCWWDSAESHLQQSLNEWVEYLCHHHPQRQQQRKQLLSLYQSLYCEYPIPILWEMRNMLPQKTSKFLLTDVEAISLKFPPLLPPPKVS